MSSHFAVIYDACVLYPAPLRDFLMHLALTGLFRARWTDSIHDEWIRSVRQNRPDLTSDQLDRTRAFMNAHVRDCLVTGFEHLIPCVDLPDADDRHVVAAAVHCRADLIVTFNLADFPKEQLARFQLEAQHPDDFILHLLDLHPSLVCEAASRHRRSLQNPPKSADEYLDTLLKQGLTQTVAELRAWRTAI